MRIVEVHFTFPPQVFLTRHVRALRENGIEPVTIALDGTNGQTGELASISEEKWDLGEVYIPAPDSKPIQKFWGLRYLLRPHTRIHESTRNKILAACIESLKPDLVHFHWANLAGYLYTIPQALHIPYTLSMRGTDVQVFPFGSETKRLSVRQAIQNSAGVHSVCDALWDKAIDTFKLEPDSINHRTIYTTIPVPDTLPPRKVNPKKTFVSIARFQWRKSHTLLLIAFAKFNHLHPDSKLVLIGDGELREGLEYWARDLQIEKSVLFVGKKNSAEIAAILPTIDAYVQSSIAEGLSNSLVEAMASGCPVFATDVDGTREVVQDGINGCLLDPVSPESWSKVLERVYDDALMASMREKAYQTVREKFSAGLHAAEFSKFYQSAIDLGQSE